MIRIYFKAAIRNLLREKGNTFINIAGLTLGLTTTLILFLIIEDGVSYDTHHTNFDRIYRVVSKGKGNTGETFSEGIPPALPEAFKTDMAEVEEVAITSYRRNSLITIPQADGSGKKYEEPAGVVFTEPSFFKIFDRPLVSGKSEKSLDDPNEAVISRKWAQRYFNTEDVIGQTVVYDSVAYTITAVMVDYPSTTDFPFDLMLSYNTIKKQSDALGWGSISDADNCYVLLREHEPVRKIEAQIPAFVKKHLGNDHAGESTFLMQPLKDIHRDMRFGNYNNKMPVVAQIAFTTIAIFMLLTACINFINLATAQAIKRTKEIGIRKVLGSSRAQLVAQLVGEAFLITITATLVSMALVPIVLAFVNPFLSLSLSLDLSKPVVTLTLAALTIIVTLLAGLYPALVVSGFKPVLALKRQTGVNASSGYTFRRSLVVVQFFISQLFIFSTLVMNRQMDFMQHHDLGFVKDAIINIPLPIQESANGKDAGKMRTLKNELLRQSDVTQASLNHTPPTSPVTATTGFTMAGKDHEISTQLKQVDGDYINLFGIDVVAGENLLDRDTLGDVVVNERLARLAGFDDPQKIVGEEILMWGRRLHVKGVVKDFHTAALDRLIEPVLLYNDRSAYRSLSVKINTSDLQHTIGVIKEKWEATYPGYIFKYDFMDMQVERMYNAEAKTAVMLNVFSAIVILIGCLGLLGLVTYMANQRVKEMGIRKVLGASAMSIMLLFSKEFARLILIGFILAAPWAYYIMSMVLEEFAYKISLGPAIFLISLAITFAIAFITVGYRSLKASAANPVESLRME